MSSSYTSEAKYLISKVSEMPKGDKIKLLLMGKTGNGKSATGNTILSGFGEEVTKFKSTDQSMSVTSTVDKVTQCVDDRMITVVDTPGTCDTSKDDEIVLTEIAGAIEKCTKGYDAFVIVMRYGARLTEEERNAVKQLEQLFGEEIYKFTIVVFTNGSQFHRTQNKKPASAREPFSQFIMRNAESSDPGELGPLVKKFGGVAVLFDNLEENSDKRGEMVAELVTKVDEIRKKNGEKCYDSGIFEYAKKLKDEMKAKNVPKVQQQKEVVEKVKAKAKSESRCTIL